MSSTNHCTSATAPQPAPSDNGRDRRGRFSRGNAGGPGNPFAANVAKLRKAALQVVTPQEIQDVFRVLLLRAQSGHLPSMKLLFAYTLGQPAASIDPDDIEQDEEELAPPPQPQPEPQPQAQPQAQTEERPADRGIEQALAEMFRSAAARKAEEAARAQAAAQPGPSQASSSPEQARQEQEQGKSQASAFDARASAEAARIAALWRQRRQATTPAGQEMPSPEQLVAIARRIVAAVDGPGFVGAKPQAPQPGPDRSATVNKPAFGGSGESVNGPER